MTIDVRRRNRRTVIDARQVTAIEPSRNRRAAVATIELVVINGRL
ncbi:hypothetical protein PQR36_33105 [Paraburkholderia nemoris]